MSQGFTTEISKEQKDIIQGTDTWEFIKIGNRIKRSGFKKIWESITKKG